MTMTTRNSSSAPSSASGARTSIVSAVSTNSPAASIALRSVEKVHRSTSFHWVGNGFHVSTYFPSEELPSERTSPFVLMDYGPGRDFAPAVARSSKVGSESSTAESTGVTAKRGVGWHPHRGFETVTLAWEGSVAHRDNAGHSGIIGPGDVQWMTAASGIFHEEYHAEEFARRGGRMHMMQLWVNLPKAQKMATPGYQPITAADIPCVDVPLVADSAGEGGGAGARVRVIAGEFLGAHGPAHTFSPITMLDAELFVGARLPVDLPASFNAMAVVAKGRIRVGGVTAGAGELVLFANDAPRLELVAEDDAHVIVLAGEPLGEPVVQYGPFVMNTIAEIEQAFLDVRAGRFGAIPA